MSDLPVSIAEGAINLLSKISGDVSLQQFRSVSGGCINNGGMLLTSAGDFFIKWNDAKKFPGMLEAEAKGLRLLESMKVIDVPQIIGYEQRDLSQFLLLEFIRPAPRISNFSKELGNRLAALHRYSHTVVGLDHHNYMGSLPQFNTTTESWIDFFINQRLQIQLELAMRSGLVDHSVVKKFEDLYKKLSSILAIEKPSLLHGDLWSGNLLINEKGEPCLIDPAVYFGHREIDLAMTTLFGGFDDDFYQAYQEVFPLQPGYQQRFDVYNLYPLLIHVNLFGRSYLRQITDILNSLV